MRQGEAGKTLGGDQARGGRRSLLWSWLSAFVALLTIGLIWWIVVLPCLQVAAVCPSVQDDIAAAGMGDYYWEGRRSVMLEGLGKPRHVVAKVRLYVQMPNWLATKKASAIEMLGLCGDEGVPLLIEVLGNRDEPTTAMNRQPMRSAAARALGRLQAQRASEVLRTSLAARCVDVRQTSARALGRIGDRRSVDALSSLLASDRDGNVRLDAVRALAAMRVTEPVCAALEDELPAVRREAAWRLGDMGDKQAVEPLIKTLEDEDLGVRAAAIIALRDIGDPRALEPLETCLKDPDPEIRRHASGALYQLRGANKPDLKQPAQEVPAQGRTILAPAATERGEDESVKGSKGSEREK